MLRSDLCDCSDVYISVKGTIDLFVAATNESDKTQKKFAFKIMLHLDYAFKKINTTLIENAEDLYIIMPMYNLLDHNQNYSVISGRLWNYYRDKIDNIHHNASDGKLFKYI